MPGTVRQMVDGTIQSTRERRLRPETIRWYESHTAPLVTYLGAATPAAAIDEAAVQRLMAAQADLSQSTLRHSAYCLRECLRWALARGWISRVPDISVPQMGQPRQEWLRPGEVAPYLDHCSAAFRPLAEAAIYFGLRESEVCVAQCGDFDLSQGLLWVRAKPDLNWLPKSGRDRYVPIVGAGRAIAEAMARRPALTWAWPTQAGERRCVGSYWPKAARRAARGAGISRDITYHDLRRTYGALAIEAGASLRAVQLALGHASVTTTERVYAPVLQGWVADEMGLAGKAVQARSEAYAQGQPRPPIRLSVAR